MGLAAGRDLLGGAGGDKSASSLTRFGAEVEDPIGVFDDIEVVFDDQEGVSLVDQTVKESH